MVFKSNLYPMGLTFRTITGDKYKVNSGEERGKGGEGKGGEGRGNEGRGGEGRKGKGRGGAMRGGEGRC